MTKDNVTQIAKEEAQPIIPDDLKIAKPKAMAIMRDYQKHRLNWYKTEISMKHLLSKDIAMFAARGIDSVDEYVDTAFNAVESSSEETVMGGYWQRILSAISVDTLDTGDLTTERDGILWVCEVKSADNTTNASSFPQELRGMRTRMQELVGRRRASGQPVKAAYCILRDRRRQGKGYDQMRVYASSELGRENRDLDGFEYRYITGHQFWKWLTGFDSEIAMLVPLANLHGSLSDAVKEARKEARERVRKELLHELRANSLGTSIDDVVRLRDLYL